MLLIIIVISVLSNIVRPNEVSRNVFLISSVLRST